MDSEALASLIERLPRLGTVDSLIIVRNGLVVADVYWHPFEHDTRAEIYSASKSIVSTLVGIAIDQGFIDGVDQRALDFFPEVDISRLDETTQAITIGDLLTMRSGFDCELALGNDPLFDLVTRPDAVQFGWNWPMADSPGSTFRYCQINVYLLSAILARATGMDPMDFAEQNLFAPLGITDASWNVSAEGLPLGFAGLMLNTQDMAKIGYLFLNGGRWQDQQVVPEDWVRASTQAHVSNPWGLPNASYGYLWWQYDTPAGRFYQAQGAYGHTINVAPAENLVVASSASDNAFHLQNVSDPVLMTSVLQSIVSNEPLPPNPEGVARLEAAIQAAAAPISRPPQRLPELASEISGKTYQFTTPVPLMPELDRMSRSDDDWAIASMGLDFEQETATLRLETVSGLTFSIPVGMDGLYRVGDSPFGPLAARGRWMPNEHFVLSLRRMEQGPMANYNLEFTQDGFEGTSALTRPGEMVPTWAQPSLAIRATVIP